MSDPSRAKRRFLDKRRQPTSPVAERIREAAEPLALLAIEPLTVASVSRYLIELAEEFEPELTS